MLHDRLHGPTSMLDDLRVIPKDTMDNITKEHCGALREMKDWWDEVIMLADKGNATVVMKRSNYDEKMEQLLQDLSLIHI